MDKSMFDNFFTAMIVVAILSAIAGVIFWELVVWVCQHLTIAWK